MDWVKHDINAHEDIKIRKLKRMHGMQAYGVYWELVELMYSKGGTLPGDSILDEVMLMGIEEDDARDMCVTFLELGLFRTEEADNHTYVWTSERVEEEFSAANSRRENMRALSAKRWGMRTASDTHPTRMRRASDTQSETREERRDYNSSSPLQEESIKNNCNNNSTSPTPIVCSELLFQGTPSPPSAVIFLTLNGGKKFAVTQDMVDKYAETFPAVDIMQELRKMNLWCDDPKNVSRRKTERGIQTFIRNWLSSEQDKARRVPQHSTEVIRGTNIQMSLVADGTRPDQEYPEVHFE